MEIEEIIVHFFTSDANRGNICSFFFSQGDRVALDKLLKSEEIILDNSKCAISVGGMLTRFEAGEENINRVMELSHKMDQNEAKSFLLYGIWRTSLNRPRVGTDLFDKLFLALEKRKACQPALIDKYLIRLTGVRGFEFVMNNRSDIELAENAQFSIELARSVSFLSAENLDKMRIFRLLNHPNPHVSVMTLESLKELDKHDLSWLMDLSEQLIHFPENVEVSITYIELLQMNGLEIRELYPILEHIDQNHPYLKNRTLGVYKEILETEDYLEKILEYLNSEGVKALHAAVALSELEMSYFNTSEIRDRIRDSLSTAIRKQNRTVINVSGRLLMDRDYFDKGDKFVYGWLYKGRREPQFFCFSDASWSHD